MIGKFRPDSDWDASSIFENPERIPGIVHISSHVRTASGRRAATATRDKFSPAILARLAGQIRPAALTLPSPPHPVP